MPTLLLHFLETLAALVPLALVAGAGALMRMRGWISEPGVQGLSRAVVSVFLPAFIFTKIVAGLDPSAMPRWWILPLVAIAYFGLGLALSFLLLGREWRQSRDVIPLGFMHNAGYFVIALGESLVPAEFDRFSAYVFLFVLGNSPLLWSVGKFYMTSGSSAATFRVREFITPPLCANLAALAAVLSGAAGWFPRPLMHGLELAGSAAIPGALLVLGASLSRVRFSRQTEWSIVLRCVLVKMVLVPAVTLAVLQLGGWRESAPLITFMLVLQAVSPHAINLIVHVRTYGGNLERAGSVILAAYLTCLVTVPLWIAVWQSLG